MPSNIKQTELETTKYNYSSMYGRNSCNKYKNYPWEQGKQRRKKTKQNRKSKIYRNGNKRNTDIEDKIKKHVEMEEGIRQIL